MVFRRARRQPEPVDDLATVAAAYRSTVADARRAKEQFESLVAGVPAGPLRDRLGELRSRIDAGVEAVWDAARRATELERVLASLDPERITAELKQARRSGADEHLVAALTARFESVQKLLNALDEGRSRLPVLEARLATAVARTAELALTTSAGGIDAVQADLDSLVVELRALGEAHTELG